MSEGPAAGGSPRRRARVSLFAIIGPGILVAATGVGAGDLATGAFSGARLGLAILWLVLLGAFLKFLLSEGLARYQLGTGRTLLEGAALRFGLPVRAFFLIYLLVWSYFVGAAMMSACGVCLHAMLPLVDAPTDKIIYGVGHSAVALVLLRFIRFRTFERLMKGLITILFVVVIATAIAARPPLGELFSGLFVPRIPDLSGQGLSWSVAMMGGVGGTLTVLCYGYWIREEGRASWRDLGTCRVDLLFGYLATALFGVAMVIIGSRLGAMSGSGANLIVSLAAGVERELPWFGAAGRWAFLIGAWCAVFSSLLGVWQSVPYLFADFVSVRGDSRSQDARPAVSTRSRPYVLFQVGLAILPCAGLFTRFDLAQKLYAVTGALFIPMLAVVLLLMNGRSGPLSPERQNSWLTVVLLWGAVLLFLWFGWAKYDPW